MKKFFIFFIFFISCKQSKITNSTYPSIVFYKDSFLLKIKPDSLSFKSVQVTNNLSKESVLFKFEDTTVSSIFFKDSIISKWSIDDNKVLDTLLYNIHIQIKSNHIYGYNLDFGYINKRKNESAIIILKPLLR